MRFVATAAFGVEAVVKRELIGSGFDVEKVENGRVYFNTDIEGMMRANLSLRAADRVYMVLSAREVLSFDALYEWVKGIPFEEYLDLKGRFHIDANSVKSTLYSERDIQSITKKALIDRLKERTGTERFKEEGDRHRILITLRGDAAEAWLDTSGEALFKRGYRSEQVEAPIKETLAAALVLLSFYERGRTLYDPFCGSGTIAIEAAMIAKSIAPGLFRSFDFEHFIFTDNAAYQRLRKEAYSAIDHSVEESIHASDIDHAAARATEENALNAGVDDIVDITISDVRHVTFPPYAVVITNPPYGSRLEGDEDLYEALGNKIRESNTCSFYVLTPFQGVEKTFKRRADKTRVLFNGPLKTRLYQYHGPPPQ